MIKRIFGFTKVRYRGLAKKMNRSIMRDELHVTFTPPLFW